MESWLFRIARIGFVYRRAGKASLVSIAPVCDEPQPSDWFWYGSDECVPDTEAIRDALEKELYEPDSPHRAPSPPPSKNQHAIRMAAITTSSSK